MLEEKQLQWYFERQNYPGHPSYPGQQGHPGQQGYPTHQEPVNPTEQPGYLGEQRYQQESSE